EDARGAPACAGSLEVFLQLDRGRREEERDAGRVVPGIEPRRGAGAGRDGDIHAFYTRIRLAQEREREGARAENARRVEGEIEHRRLEAARTRPTVEDEIDAVAERL